MTVGWTTVLGFFIIFFATTAGAALALLFKREISDRLNAVFSGFAAGVMTAASVWSLIIPAIDGSKRLGAFSFIPAAFGIMLGGLFLFVLDKFAFRLRGGTDKEASSGYAYNRSTRTFLAITIHNIPEGLAVGFAFGWARISGSDDAAFAALALAVGIAVQNFPEGAAVSLPLKRATGSGVKAFMFGTLSGAVEPIAAVLGNFTARSLSAAQPYFLSFAAGAMLFVVAEDLLPEAISDEKSHAGGWAFLFGFALMMSLDVALG